MTIRVEHNGESLTLPELAWRHGLSKTLVRQRYRRGLRAEELVAPTGSLPPKPRSITHRFVGLL